MKSADVAEKVRVCKFTVGPSTGTNRRDKTDGDTTGNWKAWHDSERASVDGVMTTESNENQVESEESLDQYALTNRQAVVLWIEYWK